MIKVAAPVAMVPHTRKEHPSGFRLLDNVLDGAVSPVLVRPDLGFIACNGDCPGRTDVLAEVAAGILGMVRQNPAVHRAVDMGAVRAHPDTRPAADAFAVVPQDPKVVLRLALAIGLEPPSGRSCGGGNPDAVRPGADRPDRCLFAGDATKISFLGSKQSPEFDPVIQSGHVSPVSGNDAERPIDQRRAVNNPQRTQKALFPVGRKLDLAPEGSGQDMAHQLKVKAVVPHQAVHQVSHDFRILKSLQK